MSLLLAGASGLLAFVAAWELAGLGRPPGLERLRRRVRAPEWVRPASLADVQARLVRAGLGARVTPERFVAGRFAGAGTGALLALAVAPVSPARALPLVVAGAVVAGGLAPDALVERAARRRRARIVTALPDALDLLAVGAGAGRSPAAMLAEIARGSTGALGEELAVTAAEIEAGSTQDQALLALADRTGVGELRTLASTLERSRCYGSPLAAQLHDRAARLRADERRRIEERAARSAPKIQLVIAMLLVPSALLAIGAALVAHAETLLQALG